MNTATSVRGVALVTGAGQRVGRAIAEDLAAHWMAHRRALPPFTRGCRRVGVNDRRGDGAARAFAGDLRAPADCEALIAAVHTHFGALDVLVNSAASMEKTPIGTTSAPQFDEIVALNLRAPFLLAQAASRVMRPGSVIVNIADHMADEPWPDYAVHGVAKAGVVSLTRHLAAALAPDIRVNAVAPGFVLAPPGYPEAAAQRFAAETPLKRLGSPSDIAHAVRYLVEAEFMTGETLHVDGGRRLRP
jgi:pteridine reductase